ncbi:MAG: RNA polymerase sigma factor [Verrucomicrobiales bacterium]
MSSVTLQSLLSRYHESGDQEAFAEVVRAAGPLVWRVAMRRLQDPQLAEEAAQNVFVILARKAPLLVRRPGLLAWLHRAATLEAASIARARRRRIHRHTAMARDLTPPVSDPPADSAIGPSLDEALDRLSTDERTLLIGRFYEERPLRELAAELGKSEEATKKQSQRALAKMETFLRGRGIATAGASLAALLTAELSRATVPAQVTASLLKTTSTVLGTAAATPSVLTHLLATMSTLKMTAAAAGLLILLLAASINQGVANAAARRTLSHLQSAPGPVGLPKPPAPGASARVATRGAPLPISASLPHPLDATSLLRSMARSSQNVSGLYDPGPDMGEAQRVIEAMTSEEKWALWEELNAADGSPALLRLAREWVLLHLVEHEPMKVMDLAVAGRFSGHLQASMKSWAAQDPQAAWTWLSQSSAEGRLLRTRAEGEAPDDVLRRGFAEGLAGRELKDAVEFTRSRLGEEGAEWLVAGTGAQLMKRADHATLLALAAGLPSDEARVRALVDAARAPYDPTDVTWAAAAVSPLLDRSDFPAHLRHSVLREVAATSHGDSVWPSLVLMHQASPPEQRGENLVWLAERFQRERPAQLSGTLTLGDPHQQQALDTALAATAEALAARGHERLAREFAQKVRDPARRPASFNRANP